MHNIESARSRSVRVRRNSQMSARRVLEKCLRYRGNFPRAHAELASRDYSRLSCEFDRKSRIALEPSTRCGCVMACGIVFDACHHDRLSQLVVRQGRECIVSSMYHLTVISLALVAVMTIIGLGFLLPNCCLSKNISNPIV